MKKFLNFFDNYLLKIGVSFLIVFVAWYPKLPSVHIIHTWVYVRLEDFAIAAVLAIWLIQLLRRKVKLPIAQGFPIALYWIFGFLSLIFSFIFVGPYINNFYPTVALLSYVRRIEYMVLFFVAFSTIRSIKDVKDYIVILSITVFGFILYGIGQRYYLGLWAAFPAFFNKYQFCFPSFQTGNEEFAKGIPLCLPIDARITSTFAGHYDLGAYLVVIIPIFTAVTLVVKKNIHKFLMGGLTLLSMITIILTASRISYVAYIIGTIIVLLSIKKKKFILPLLVISMLLLVFFSEATAKRFLQTFRLTSVVTNSQGQIVGEALSPDLQKKLEKDKGILANIPSQALPEGSGFIGLPQIKKQTTNTAVVKSNLTTQEARELKLQNGGIEISTISGNFLVQKAFVYDISFTTRFQAEWPNAIRAFLKNPILGSGFSTITLATDNDFLRSLGESGLLGLLSFLLIFIIFKITFKSVSPNIKDPITLAFIYGLAGGIIGLFINASLIDVFESSKVAETLWILSGIAVGAALLHVREKIDYKGELIKMLTSDFFIWIYIIVAFLIVIVPSLGNFFVADDFTWLKTAATSNLSDLGRNFINAREFFYRPLDHVIVFFLNTFFAFKPEGYHLVLLTTHFLSGLGVYLIAKKILNKRSFAFLVSLIFIFVPSQGENLFWISTLSPTFSTFFIIWAVYLFIRFREGSALFYVPTVVLSALALVTYEMGVIFLPLFILVDFVLLKTKFSKKTLSIYLPLIALEGVYGVIRSNAHVVAIGGDYSYSVVHFVPNLIGNFIGYLGLFIFGEKFFIVYDGARALLKSESSAIIVFIIVAFVVLLGVIFATKDRIIKIYKNNNFKIFIFGLLFAFLSLLPFLGLGNISQRYGYLASVGFAIDLALIIYLLSETISNRFKLKEAKRSYVVLVFIFILGLFYFKNLNDEKVEWQNAGKITQRTLSFFRLYYENIHNNSNIYIVNLPIKSGQAWVFPTGINDGIWFIYRDDSIKIKNFVSISDAKNEKASLSPKEQEKTYIFYFDKDKKIQEAE